MWCYWYVWLHAYCVFSCDKYKWVWEQGYMTGYKGIGSGELVELSNNFEWLEEKTYHGLYMFCILIT